MGNSRPTAAGPGVTRNALLAVLHLSIDPLREVGHLSLNDQLFGFSGVAVLCYEKHQSLSPRWPCC